MNDWRKSSHSGGSGGNCLETASENGAVLIRDTKNAGNGPVLRVSPEAWKMFTSRLK